MNVTLARVVPIGVLELGQDLALVAEAPRDGLGVQSAPDDLDRDLFLEGLIGARGQVHHPHTTLADLPDHSVRTDQAAGRQGLGAALQELRGFGAGLSLSKAVAEVRGEQRFNLGPQRGVRAA